MRNRYTSASTFYIEKPIVISGIYFIFVLFLYRAKYHKLKYGTDLNPEDLKPPQFDKENKGMFGIENYQLFSIELHVNTGFILGLRHAPLAHTIRN